MELEKHADNLSKKMTKFMRWSHKSQIVITDDHHTPLLHFPVLLFGVVFFIFPVLAGILLFVFLLTENHIIIKN